MHLVKYIERQCKLATLKVTQKRNEPKEEVKERGKGISAHNTITTKKEPRLEAGF